MRTLHVGVGTTGAMTIFPVWGEYARVGLHVGAPGALSVVEQDGGATIGSLMIENLADVTVIVFEGQILERGWQNRMVAQSYVLAPRATSTVDVVFVEEGRWHGGRDHRAAGRRGSGRVRSGLRDGNRQQSVWNRVREYEAAFGATQTASFTKHADRLTDRTSELSEGLRTLPSQIGVVVAMAGQPVFAEIFSDHATMVREFDSIVRAAGLDAIGKAEIETPSRRARRFVDRASRVSVAATGAAGLGRSVAGRDQYVQVSGLEWNGADTHLVLTNPRHELNRVSA